MIELSIDKTKTKNLDINMPKENIIKGIDTFIKTLNANNIPFLQSKILNLTYYI
jgi:hypothetical protein